ncbi:MAG TPA: hypothetical protein VMM57_11345 [Bacteroidota bacterium]|nr:hypothetical protein [Bacteroidota bacterium]
MPRPEGVSIPPAGFPRRFMWYHRDEIQVLVVFVVIILFFSRSQILSLDLAGFVVLAFVLGYLYRIGSSRYRLGQLRGITRELYERAENFLTLDSPSRSRLFMAKLSVVVVGALLLHRVDLMRRDASFATPTDVYWILFLSWYLLLWLAIVWYFVRRALRSAGTPSSSDAFLQNLTASIFFYHGLPTRLRVVTFGLGLALGGIPSYFAAQLRPERPIDSLLPYLLIIPVIALSLIGVAVVQHSAGVAEELRS